MELLDTVRASRETQRNALVTINERLNQLQHDQQNIKSGIINLVEKLRASIDKRGEQLTHDLSVVCVDKLSSLLSEREAVMRFMGRTERYLSKAENAMDQGADVPLSLRNKMAGLLVHMPTLDTLSTPQRIRLNKSGLSQLFAELACFGSITQPQPRTLQPAAEPWSDITHSVVLLDPVLCDADSGISRKPRKSSGIRSVSRKKLLAAEESLKFHPCPSCTKSFPNRTRLNRHVVQVHTNEPAHCSMCNKSYKSKHHLEKHMQLHNDPYTCAMCNKTFTRKQHIREHMQSHMGDNIFQCVVCQKRCTTKRNLRRHFNVHDKEFQCSHCEKSYSRKEYLNIHVRRDHTSAVVVVKGEVMDKEERRESMEKEGTREVMDKEATREVMDKEATREVMDKEGPREVMDKEGRREAMEKEGMREVIDKEGPREVMDKEETMEVMDKEGMREVMDNEGPREVMDHKGTSDYQCSLCWKAMSSRQQLVRHLRDVHASTAHCCKECGKQFKTSAHHKRHLLTHKSERKFECLSCCKLFSRKDNLAQHELTHTKPFLCGQCGVSFGRKKDLNNHRTVAGH